MKAKPGLLHATQQREACANPVGVAELTTATRQMSALLRLREVKAVGWPVSHVRSHLRRGMVIVMGGSSQLCCYCNEVTERTSDGDRLACSMCGRPYLVAPDQPTPYARPTDPPPHDRK